MGAIGFRCTEGDGKSVGVVNGVVKGVVKGVVVDVLDVVDGIDTVDVVVDDVELAAEDVEELPPPSAHTRVPFLIPSSTWS